MLYFYTGSDRDKVRKEAQAAASKLAGKNGTMIRITDAHTLADLSSVLQGAGMFPPGGGQAAKRIVTLDGVLANDEMRAYLIELLPALQRSEESFFIVEERLDAQMRRTLEKYAEASKRFDAEKGKREGGESFALAYALRRGDKKVLWVSYQQALQRDEAPEALHGILFWAAKQMALSARAEERRRGCRVVAELAELPHEARRQGIELEYALERYILGIAGAEQRRSINKQ